MDHEKLDAVLRAMSRERYVPSEALVRSTKSAIRGKRLFQCVLFLSLSSQLLILGIIVSLLTFPEVPLIAQCFGWMSLVAYMGIIIVVTMAARDRVKWFFKKAEQLIV